MGGMRDRGPVRARRRRAVVGPAVLGIATLASALPGGGSLAAGAAVVRGAQPSRVAKPTNGTALDPKAFAPGACMAFAPTHGDRHQTAFLDAGHGGVDPGGTGETEGGEAIAEAPVNLAVELDAMALLRAKGYRVVVSRTGDTTVVRLGAKDTDQGVLSLQGSHDDVVARDRCADLARATVLVGIAMDSGDASNAGSVTVYDADRPFSASNSRLATLLQRDVLADLDARGWQIPDGGVMPDTGYGSSVGDPSSGGLAAEAAGYDHLLLIGPAQPGYFTTPSTMPGAVIEPLYLTDPFEASIAVTPPGQQIIARGIATAVEQYLAPGAARSTAPASAAST